MPQNTIHSKSGLFLMEMIFVLLFLGLTCAICVRLFAGSYSARQSAREKNHIQELTVSVGEVLEGTDGTTASFLSLLPDGILDGTQLHYCFDKNWQTASYEEAFYVMTINLAFTDTIKSADIRFDRISGENASETIYTLTIRYPVIPAKEAS